jgi:hypothetical protein
MKRQKKTGIQPCLHPKLDLKHDTNQFAYHSMPPLNCTGNGFFYPHTRTLKVNQSVIPDPSVLGKCSFFNIDRVSDNVYNYAEPVVVAELPFEVAITSDFVRILCLLKTTLAAQEKEKEGEGSSKEKGDDGDENYEENRREEEKDEYGGGGGGGDGGKDGETAVKFSEDAAYRTRRKLEYNEGNDDRKNAEGGDDGGDNNDTNEDDYHARMLDDIEWPYDDTWDYVDANNPDNLESDYDQFLVQIQPKVQVFQRIAKITSSSPSSHSLSSSSLSPLKLNVMMLALDSMSHLCFQRKMPKTYAYLKEELGAAILENYNIVGDATTAALIPMLTGKVLS